MGGFHEHGLPVAGSFQVITDGKGHGGGGGASTAAAHQGCAAAKFFPIISSGQFSGLDSVVSSISGHGPTRLGTDVADAVLLVAGVPGGASCSECRRPAVRSA